MLIARQCPAPPGPSIWHPGMRRRQAGRASLGSASVVSLHTESNPPLMQMIAKAPWALTLRFQIYFSKQENLQAL